MPKPQHLHHVTADRDADAAPESSPHDNAQIAGSFGLPGTYAGVLVAVGIGVVLLVSLVGGRTPRTTILIVVPLVVATLLGAAFGGAWWLGHRMDAGWRVIGAACAGGMLGTGAGVAAAGWLRDETLDSLISMPLFRQGLPAGAVLGAIVGLGLMLLARARSAELAAARKTAAVEMARLRLEKDRTISELKVLQAQIEPHFLHNTLANLRYLVRTDADAAATMLEHLIRYFKGALPGLRSEGTMLGAELDLCEAYIDIMRIRTGAALEWVVRIRPEIEGATVPAGMLLTLVENAIKHGMPSDDAVRSIRVDAARRGNALVIDVIDNGPGPAAAKTDGGGVGLANIRERLALQFKDGAGLQLLAAQPRGCRARLELPYCEAAGLLANPETPTT